MSTGIIARDSLAETGSKGSFVRKDSVFRNFVSVDHPIYQPERDRYHLYISHACPWATRCNTVRIMKGLEEVLPLSVVHPTWERTRPQNADDLHCGWTFRSPSDPAVTPPSGTGSISCEDCIPDTNHGCKFVRDLYELSQDTEGKYTVPILWDKKTSTIVNNESSEILRMLNGPFAKLVGTDTTTQDLYPEALRARIDEVNDWVYHNINNGVYKCGFAREQGAYDEAVTNLFAHLDKVEAILSESRFLVSNTAITEADIRLFQTLVRFDAVYVVYFKCNVRTIASYPNMHQYCRELYQLPYVQKAVNLRHIKEHYFSSHAVLNPYSVVPKGPDVIGQLLEPHDRARFDE